jgi:hypothetical protein
MNEINLYSKNMLKGMEELKKGRWNPGFNLYEYRTYSPVKIPLGVKNGLARAPLWTPGIDVKGYNIVVENEQGIGDTIMHSRFITLLRQIPVKSVHIAMNRNLNPLIGSIEGVDGILVGNDVERGTIRVKVLSLGALLMQYRILPDKQPEKVYGSEGYFKFDVEKTDKVGFCWFSHNSSWNAEAKKIPTDVAESFYKKLKKHKDVVSLQVQPDFMPSYLDGRDWLDTAKKLAALDAIVTIDTGVAHLAGALGVRTINLIGAEQYAGWFYFPAQSPTTPWYDSMELVWYEPFTNWKAGLDEALKRLCR